VSGCRVGSAQAKHIVQAAMWAQGPPGIANGLALCNPTVCTRVVEVGAQNGPGCVGSRALYGFRCNVTEMCRPSGMPGWGVQCTLP